MLQCVAVCHGCSLSELQRHLRSGAKETHFLSMCGRRERRERKNRACRSVLQCVAVCCRVSQCVAVCCGESQSAAKYRRVLQCVAVFFVCCSVLQCVLCVAVCCSVCRV